MSLSYNNLPGLAYIFKEIYGIFLCKLCLHKCMLTHRKLGREEETEREVVLPLVVSSHYS